MTVAAPAENSLAERLTNYADLPTKWQREEVLKLALCWAFTLTTSTLLTTVGPLAADKTGASKVLAPFTVGAFLIGAAVSSVPSGELFRRYGRYWGFAGGCVAQIAGSAFGTLAMFFDDPILLFVGCFCVGLGQGLGQFYRFAAVEITPDEYKSKSVTYVLSGGIIAAFLGPTSASYSAGLVGPKYAGSFLVMALMGVLNWGVLAMINFPAKDIHLMAKQLGLRSRPLLTIVSQPVFILSCTVATIAHTVMVMIMSNCTLAMKEDYSFQLATIVLETHFLAMFLPGFYTGSLIKRHGTFTVSVLGAIVFAISSVAFGLGKEKWNYFSGMILLGFAWNLSFSAGTVMLTDCYLPHEAADVQAVNDFILFTVAGVGSLISGVIYTHFSWGVLIYSSSFLMGINLFLFFVVYGMKDQILEGGIARDLEDGEDIGTVDTEGADDFGPLEQMDNVAFARKLSYASVTSDASRASLQYVRTISIT